MHFILPYIGKIDLSNLEDYYETTIDFKGNEIELDINFESEDIEVRRLNLIKSVFKNISSYDLKNLKYIKNDYRSTEADIVRFYIKHHIEELGQDILSHLVNYDILSPSPELQLLDKLHLIRVGIYLDNEDFNIVFDYTIDEEITNYLVVVNTDENGNLDYITSES
ncbi:MAG: DUF2004 domain-containing protein [Flammeovirgaceae bacterium]